MLSEIPSGGSSQSSFRNCRRVKYVSQVPGFLQQFSRQTGMLRRPARPKLSVGRPRSLTQAESRTPEPCPSPDTVNQQSRAAWKKRSSQEVVNEHTAFDRRRRSFSSRDRISWALLLSCRAMRKLRQRVAPRLLSKHGTYAGWS